MHVLFSEDFSVKKNKLPGNWSIEWSSDLRIPAAECGGGFLELLSPGNKYIPVTPSVKEAKVGMRVGFNPDAGGGFEGIVSFRYDVFKRRGEALRFLRREGDKGVGIEYGEMRDNKFSARDKRRLDVPDDILENPVDFSMSFSGAEVSVEFSGKRAVFSTGPCRPGKIAVSRGHFQDVMRIHSFEILTANAPVPVKERSFSVDLPSEPTLYPVKCEVNLKDYGDCSEAELEFSGGVRETPAGEGNYHGKRTDLLTNPFFKVITSSAIEKYVLYEGRMVLIVEELAPPFFNMIHDKVDWPMRRTVRFNKPSEEFCMAVGFDEFLHNTMKNSAQRPSETLFSHEGEELYSGVGLTGKPQHITFHSQPDKKIIGELPRGDPRHEKAVEFAKKNHYFTEGEKICFTPVVESIKEMPEILSVTLENAFFEKVRSVGFTGSKGSKRLGPLEISEASCECEPLEGLKPGVYHLRVKSDDPSVSALEDYCAFEVLSLEPGAKPPPLLSGLPFLYTSRTETRGLATDAFDPWHGSSVDEGHYMACANFLPACARLNRVAPTLKAYRREWFLWLGSRCCDDWTIDANADLIPGADYVNVSEEMGRHSLLWRNHYKGRLIDYVIEFAEMAGGGRLDPEKIRGLKAAGECLDEQSYRIMGEYYWHDWLDFVNEAFQRRRIEFLDKIRGINPAARLADYGPFPAYTSHYKGAEFIRVGNNAPVTAGQQGFWQFEDYPMACSYGVERGTYLLASCLMAMPGHRIFPEIYTTSLGGCPDGAVFFAHPPFGVRAENNPLRIRRRVYEYAFGSAYFTDKGFDYWRDCGFQTCGFDRPRYEALLNAWRAVRDYPPERPLKGAAFVYSEESWKGGSGKTVINRESLNGGIIDVRNTSAESVPFVYEMSRRRGVMAGFVADAKALGRLDASRTGLLVLPPLAGVSENILEAVRALHAKGVSLMSFEDVSGLEDIFGVRDSGVMRSVTHLKAAEDFLGGMEEYCDEPLCGGKYEADGARVMVGAEIPVVTAKKNGNAEAVLFNVPPTLVRDDQLHERLGYGKESISDLMNAAAGELAKKLSGSPVETTAGRIIGFRARGGEQVVMAANPPGEEYVTPVISIKKDDAALRFFSCDAPYIIIEENEMELKIRLMLDEEESALIVMR